MTQHKLVRFYNSLASILHSLLLHHKNAETMTSYSRVAAVTGGNKGVGFACVRQLALQYPQSSFNSGPFLIYLTARNKERGEAAVQSILDDPQLKQAKALRHHGGLSDVKYLPLDIDSSQSIGDFAATLKREHPEGIDMLINNAGIAMEGFNVDVVRTTLHCNYYGTLQATQQLLPHVRQGGRIVNVASAAGHLGSAYAADIKARFVAADKVEDITAVMEEFTDAVSKGSWQSQWPGAAYKVSKAGVIGVTRIVAAQEAARRGVLLNVCCPGYVDTDMTKHRGVKTPDQGAQTPVLLALGDIHGVNGEFWENEKISQW